MMDKKDWDNLAGKNKHYLTNPFLCKSKRRELSTLIKKWSDAGQHRFVLLTDVFEDSIGFNGILRWLRIRHKFVCGMDLSFAIAKKALINSGFKQQSLLVTDIRDAAFKDSSFDLIISDSTIDHFPELEQALKELSRLLKDGGTLILTLHNKLNALFSVKMWLKRKLGIKDYSYGYSYTLGGLKNKLKDAGFSVKEHTYLYFYPPVIRLLMPDKKNKLGQMLKKSVRLYQVNMRKSRYFNIFTAAVLALKLSKDKA